MSNLQHRVTQLEKRHAPGTPSLTVNYLPGQYERAIQSLADALTEITGQPTTPEEVLRSIQNEQLNQPH